MAKYRGVLLVMYDLPVTTAIYRKNALGFRKFLLRMGYTDLQKSIYVKVVRNQGNMNSEMQAIKRVAPKVGSIFVLPLGLEQFRQLCAVTGEPFNMSVFSDSVLVI